MRSLGVVVIVIAAACGGSNKKPEPATPVANESTPAEPAPEPAVSSGADDDDIYGGLLGNEAGGTMYGGFGYGSGYGTGAATSAQVPTVKIGQPNATGDLDKAIIRRYIKRNLQKISYCYEKELVSKPSIAGTVKATFTIEPTGLVSASTATGVDGEVATCVAKVIEAIEFPKPQGGGKVNVNYPFVFQPAGG